jgi:hypothetical protein
MTKYITYARFVPFIIFCACVAMAVATKSSNQYLNEINLLNDNGRCLY